MPAFIEHDLDFCRSGMESYPKSIHLMTHVVVSLPGIPELYNILIWS